jgi:pimeloyl-ACP methyl ester carboxylesterase
MTLLLVSACASVDPDAPSREPAAFQLARQARLNAMPVSVDGFVLMAFGRVEAPGQPVEVYIEGDGCAWVSRTHPSSDPTPRRPVALELAALDPRPNVVYLARPCQYDYRHRAACDSAYWTGKRFSPEVIRAMNQALDVLLPPEGSVHLIGYSGGAAVAVLLAERRRDVTSLRTVAGNLDSEAVNRYHGVSPMPQSLNPVDAAPRLAHLPQAHFIGAHDDVVPESIARSFARSAGDTECVQIVKVADAAHDDGWREKWLGLLALPLTCAVEARVPNLDMNSRTPDAL